MRVLPAHIGELLLAVGVAGPDTTLTLVVPAALVHPEKATVTE